MQIQCRTICAVFVHSYPFGGVQIADKTPEFRTASWLGSQLSVLAACKPSGYRRIRPPKDRTRMAVVFKCSCRLLRAASWLCPQLPLCGAITATGSPADMIQMRCQKPHSFLSRSYPFLGDISRRFTGGYGDQCASNQLSPEAIPTRSGTGRSTACSISSWRIAYASSTQLRFASTSSSSCT